MTAEIVKIHEPKQGSGGNYVRVEFKLEDGSWAKTDLVPAFRNWNRWVKYLSPGIKVTNLRMKNSTTIDADSRPNATR